MKVVFLLCKIILNQVRFFVSMIQNALCEYSQNV